MGSVRFTVGTVVRIVSLKHYRGRISFLPAHDDAGTSVSYFSSFRRKGAIPFPAFS